ncbi:MAG: VWA domain-containing protein [Acidobacteria bacterium]|nr:VWA domain-containing protein [Acidobacteriota bacterium]
MSQVPDMGIWSGSHLHGISSNLASAQGERRLGSPVRLRLLAALLSLGVLPRGASAQAPEQAQEPPEQTIRIVVKEVQIPFSVFDNKESLVLDMKKEDFRIFEDGVEQQVQYFSAPTNLPLRFGILIDTSSSARLRMKFEKEAAMQLGYYVLTHHSDHQGFLMTFDHGPDVLQDYTTNPDDLTTALDGLQAAGGTALFDAIIEACQKNLLAAPGPGIPRRVLVIFSDGEDTLSKHSLEQTIDVALRADARIFAISSNGYGMNAPGDEVLKRLVEQTNGRMYSPLEDLPSTAFATGYISKHQLGESQNSVFAPGTGQYTAELAAALTKALEAIGDELTNQYAIGYTSSNNRMDGKFRTVEIRTRRNGVELRHKKGYYAVP